MRVLGKIIGLTALFAASNIYAAAINYSLELAENSPLKEVPLKNITVKIAVYSNGTPQGFQEKLTDQNQTFVLDGNYAEPIAVEVLSIENEAKQLLKCYGIAEPGQTHITLSCEH